MNLPTLRFILSDLPSNYFHICIDFILMIVMIEISLIWINFLLLHLLADLI